MIEQKMPVTFSLLACIIILVTWDPLLVHGEPDPMARPTRPKVFTSAEELRRYLDLVRDYYSLNGKARYGKRALVIPMFDNPWGVVRIPPTQAGFFALRQQQLEQLQQMENPAKHQLQREILNRQQEQQLQEPRQFQQGGQQAPNEFSDMMTKYYDEIQ